MTKQRARQAIGSMCAALLLAGCVGGEANFPEVVVYTAHDATFSEPIFGQFTAATSIEARAKFDVESTKTVGLVNAILRESERPRCDVFWNNEILNTLRLKRRGLLEAYESPSSESFPAEMKDPDGTWCGFAARVRVIVCNAELLPDVNERPHSIEDLLDPRWRGKAAIAKPLFGTTATHAACLYAIWGAERTQKFFRDLKANDIQVLGGNKQVAEAVARGAIAWGLTDTDDVLQMLDQGSPVTMIYPDQQEGGLGALRIPNSVAILKGCPHPDEARRLVDYLLAPPVERQLAEGPAGQIPVNPQVDATSRAAPPAETRWMDVDFQEAAACWDEAAQFLAEQF
ncbi:MAG: extracellular solute-binding protein [Planctomycetales bacterium]|nr:extracellular solute-binding protein [Planctomycetales bacterium]